jgi:protease I
MAKICMPLAEDFEDSEYSVPRERLAAAGHEVIVVGSQAGAEVRGKGGKKTTRVDAGADEVSARDFDALVIPGGYSPDHLRMDASVVELVKSFGETGRPIAAVCHGPQLLIEADLVKGRTLTSWPSVRKDLENAGALWVDSEVCVDGNIITSRKPDDLEAFSRAILERLSVAA